MFLLAREAQVDERRIRNAEVTGSNPEARLARGSQILLRAERHSTMDKLSSRFKQEES